MPKTVLSAIQQFDLRQAIQVATLEALMASRRWQPGELVFQGGTSLHLAHGSPRFSEDLDFLVQSSLDLSSLGASVEARLRWVSWLPPGTSLKVSRARDPDNLHAFVVSVGGPEVIGAVRVKVEMWRADARPMNDLCVVVLPVRIASGPGAGAQAFVPTENLAEIHADKVFALGARTYLKPRDLFDLHWIEQRQPGIATTPDDLETRLRIYPNESPLSWIEKSEKRLKALETCVDIVQADLTRWLPSSWPLQERQVRDIVTTSAAALQRGMEAMQAVARLRPASSRAETTSRPRP